MYHYIRDATGYDNFRTESGQYISDIIPIESSSVKKGDQAIINNKIFELLDTIYDESIQDIGGFFGLSTGLKTSEDPMIRCKKTPDNKWRTIYVMVNPTRRPKNGKYWYEVTIYYMTIIKLD